MLQNIKGEYLQSIKSDQELQLKIAKVFSKRNIVTVQRWAKNSNPLLTLPAVQVIIRDHLGLPMDVELTENAPINHIGQPVADAA